MNEDPGRLQYLVACFQTLTKEPEALDLVLRRAGLPKTISNASGEIDPITEAAFVRHACDVLDDATFGVRAGLGFNKSDTLSGYIGQFSVNLRSAIENSQRYYSTIDPSHEYSLQVSGNSASFVIERTNPSFVRYHRYTEFLVFGALARLRSITRTTFFPIEARLDHDVKDSTDAIQKLAGFPVVFGAEKSELVLSLSTLELPVPTYNPALRSHLMQYGERLLGENSVPDPSLRARIESILANSLPGRAVSADEVASNLGLSRRTFARRLKDEGLSFRCIVDDLRCDLAKTYLKNGFSISEVAFFLDYADQAAFSTAFKRWTKSSPSDFKKSTM